MLSPEQVRELLQAMCDELGVCLSGGHVERLAARPPESVEAFVDEVVRIEWEDAGLENGLRSEMEAMVSNAMARALAQAS
ncbi:MAG: hypothetical protein JJ863_03175 [Deltaproteobacteria bacterium]|nr:hypothetical protein [Deltaproteobacteria bacterium]